MFKILPILVILCFFLQTSFLHLEFPSYFLQNIFASNFFQFANIFFKKEISFQSGSAELMQKITKRLVTIIMSQMTINIRQASTKISSLSARFVTATFRSVKLKIHDCFPNVVVWCSLVMASIGMEVARTPEEPPDDKSSSSSSSSNEFEREQPGQFLRTDESGVSISQQLLLSPQLFSACGSATENTQQKKRQYRIRLIYDQKKLIALSKNILNAIKGIPFNEIHCS